MSTLKITSASEATRETLDLIEPWAAVQAHGIFDCRCGACRAGYFAWCDSPATGIVYDQSKLERYERMNPWLVTESRTRGFVSFSDLLCAGHSIDQLRALTDARCANCGMTRGSLMFREYEAGTEWSGHACCGGL